MGLIYLESLLLQTIATVSLISSTVLIVTYVIYLFTYTYHWLINEFFYCLYKYDGIICIIPHVIF